MKLTYVARSMTLASISLAVAMIACQTKPARVGDSGKPVESAAPPASTATSAPAAPAGRSLGSAGVDSVKPTTKPSEARRARESAKQTAPQARVGLSEDGAGSTTIAAAPGPLAPRPALSPPSAAPEPLTRERPTPSIEEALARLPFSTGERFEFQVKFGSLSVGNARLEVVGLENVRGVPTVHTIFSVRGGVPFYRVNDRYESWFDPRDLSVLRAVQNVDQGRYERDRRFEVFPESKTFTENDKPAEPSVEGAVDEGAFIYLVRTMVLEPGQTHEISRYFRPDRNPVRLQVVRKERVKVPAGEFETVVVQPTIKARGIFSEGGRAEIWFSNDSSRAVVQLKSKLKVGSLSLLLKSRHPGGAWGEIPK